MANTEHILSGFELLTLRKFMTEPSLWLEWKHKLRNCDVSKVTERGSFALPDIGPIPQNLWYLSVVLHKRLDFLMRLIDHCDNSRSKQKYFNVPDSLLTLYVNLHHFTELHLDRVFKFGEDNTLPRELFKCESVKHLSLKYNCLDRLPSDIGRMSQLEYLALTNNKLVVHSIPFSLTFCTNLSTLLLDNNLLDALPGFLLKMKSLFTVHRHGNHNYFKSTFMWYHTDVSFRIIPTCGTNDGASHGPDLLQFWGAKSVIGSKQNFFREEALATAVQDYVADVYERFNICDHCNNASLSHHSGYKVITFKNPYLGNTCVPFQHWACSVDCAKSLEVPARLEQIAAARDLEKQYEDYIVKCLTTFDSDTRESKLFSCASSRSSARHTTDNCGCTLL